jgi:protein-S-isoprenylcysteine O-methyltransferase Ste14
MGSNNEKTWKNLMDPLNIIVGLNIIATFGANVSGAKKGLKASVMEVREKPVSNLQKIPLILATLTLIALILGVFQVGTLEYTDQMYNLRISGLVIYLLFSWFQVYSYRSLGDNYAQDILIYKNHELVSKGPYRVIRHPHYLSQIIMDIGGGFATLSYLVMIFTLIEIPFIIKRAVLEEKILEKYFKEDFKYYKQKTGFMIPFIG